MNTSSDRKRPRTILLVLLILAILLDRCLIAGVFPWASGLGINPIVVFLDIPVQLPVIFDLPVMALFFFFYWLLLLSYPSRYGGSGWRELSKKLWGFFTGGLAVLLCLAAGGGFYYLCSGLMSREVRNGIDSFGIQADIYTPIPDHEIIHLKGSMILLICLFIGVRIFIKITKAKTVRNVPEQPHEIAGVIIDLPGTKIDPRIAGFQGKGKAPGEREVAVQQQAAAVLPREPVMPPRATATSVSVVAPRPVKLN